ncbi:Mg-chelatase subunit ChlD [Owenweeksia hongkongensis DSM 17368]|uniref:Mg-chelatase subunit ChlD n=1 Tax=Owenweeksia hongkongensis (strain DSM 17368 / CIP 108786 / JCM 12287 / NRRL B-23963 / UST20020801) TaxID=926562 RepID=G8R560_OWEHD|nr:VWA domain-containing protein [Owenweeksia hongkongensis]AEV31071.1 Mg-chelatase subunit ChlD [Owenweeksia hongkongensis DSM 17368]
MLPDNFELAFPWMLWLLPLPILVYFILPPLRMKSEALYFPGFKKAAGYTGDKPRKSAMVKRRNFFSWLILMIIWVLMIGALSSPQLVGEPEMKVKTARNFLITADISFSMAQKDWKLEDKKVRRWDAVKSLMHDFIKERKGDRMGLVFFATNSYVQAPFTPDLQTVDQLLDEADVGMAGQMTHIGKAISMGISLFKEDTIKTKVMLLLTDGVDGGADILPLDGAEMAKKDSVIIYTIGIGEPGTSGSDLDEKTLQEIAEITGGKYFRAKDADALKQVYEEVNKLEPIEFEEEENRPVTLLYMYPLGAALGLALAASFLSVLVSLLMQLINKR